MFVQNTPLTHLIPPHQIYNKSYSSASLVSFLYLICYANISLRPDEVASVWMPAKACHDFIMISLCFSTTRFYSSSMIFIGFHETPRILVAFCWNHRIIKCFYKTPLLLRVFVKPQKIISANPHPPWGCRWWLIKKVFKDLNEISRSAQNFFFAH